MLRADVLVCVRALDSAAVTPLWDTMLDELDAVTPLVDDARTGVAFLDLRGIRGDPSMWMAQTRDVLEPFSVPIAVGSGPNKFCAYAAAWIGDGTIVGELEAPACLASLPLDVLESFDPNAAETIGDSKERLQLLGVTTLGELARLPHGPFVRRFGRNAAHWHERARGIDRTPFIPRAHAIAIEASIFGEGRAEEEEQVFFALRLLLSRVCCDLERCGKRTSLVQLVLELEDGDRSCLDVMLALPSANERVLLDVLRAKLEGKSFASPIVGMRLRALRLEEGGEAQPLFAGDDIDRKNVAAVLTRLESLIGEPVLQAQTHPAYPLERQYSYAPFTIAPQVQSNVILSANIAAPQLRLSAVTEIDVHLERGEPAFVQGAAVAECAGPWRIEEGWFSAPVARDEYDVFLDTGEICRIYRQGNRWYLRGTYD
jgi:hypothetical protein